MAHFYGTLQGGGGEATRTGTKNSGMETVCASWQGAVQCRTYTQDGEDFVRVEKIPWRGAGENRILYDGPIGEVKMVTCNHPDRCTSELTAPCPECKKREGRSIDNSPHFPDAE